MLWIPLAISVGAVLGALGRYYATLLWVQEKGSNFPYGTLFVNLVGAFLIGLMSILVSSYTAPAILQKCIIAGFLGAFTTFSSYVLDTFSLFSRRQFVAGALYWLGSPVLGLLCAKLGVWIGAKLVFKVQLYF